MKKQIILALETSCDDTCASIMVDNNIKANIKIPQNIHSEYNGVYPEYAARLHYEKIIIAIEMALKKSKIKITAVTHIAYTFFPGLIGSLLVSKIIAETLSLFLNIPIIKINHLYGHLSSTQINYKTDFPALGIIISGGHTNIYILKNIIDYKEIGHSLDDSIGEALDKIGVHMLLKYPAGPKIDKIAEGGRKKYIFPVYENDKYNFSFSGIKTSAKRMFTKKNNDIKINDFCASLQYYIFKQVENVIAAAIKNYKKINTILVTGGVSANGYIRKKWPKIFPNNKVIFPKKEYSTDNAAMIAKYCYNLINEKKHT